MNEELPETAPKKARPAIPVLFGIVLGLLVANAMTFVRLDSMKRDVATMKESIVTEIAKVRETTTLSSSSSRQSAETLRQELEQTRRQASTASGTGSQRRLEARRTTRAAAPGGSGGSRRRSPAS